MRRSAHGRRVTGGVALLAALAAILAGCGGSGQRGETGATIADSGTPAVASRPALTHKRLPHGVAVLRAALDKQFAKAGRSSGAAVYDLSDGMLFSLRARIARPPASVEKLYTSVAVLSDFGPRARLHTQVMGAGYLGPHGVWRGNLYLVGGGDPTLGDGGFNRNWEGGYGPTSAQLAHQLESRGIRGVSGHLIGDGSIFDARRGPPSSGFAPDVGDLGGQLGGLTYDHGATTRRLSPGAFAARELALTLRARHVAVRASRVEGSAPVGARQLATVSSPPMSALVRLMDVPSDDLFAEMLCKQLGLRFGAGGGTTAAGAQVISDAIAPYGIHPQIIDGSGLSRSDRSSPEQVVTLLRSLHGTPIGTELYAALPAVGVSGTVRSIAGNTAARGACMAKTGTLNGVTNLAGWCHSRGGKLLAFALFIDGPSNWRALELISAMVTSIARF